MKKPLLLLAFVLLATLPASAQAAPGDLDPSFGSGGLVTTDFGGRSDFGLAVAVQSDGKIVTAGNSSAIGVFSVSFALSRHNADGTLDAGFGSGGTVLTSFGGMLSAASDVTVQPDGKLVAVGIANGDFGVARYNADGSLDATFGSGGLVTTDFGGFDQANGVTVQPDGKIVVVGPLSGALGMARYNPDGSLDATFGSGGKVVTTSASAFDVAIAADGKIVVGGGTSFFPFGPSDFLLLRYTTDGSLDSSFGSGGRVATDFGGSDTIFGIALGADGTITAAGGANGQAGDFGVARYTADGALEWRTTTDIAASSSDTANGVVVNPDGSSAVAGLTSSAPGSSAFALARYTAAGALEGTTTATFGNPINNVFDIARQADGKVVVAGGTADFSRGISDFALARFLGGAATIEVTVDVKPDDADNVISLQATGVVTVAIITTNAFDAATIDPASVCFVHDCTEKHGTGHLEDVNADGRTDLLLHYETQETGIAIGDTQACLTGRTYSGAAIHGCDRITVK